jgi:hypothetical protein
MQLQSDTELLLYKKRVILHGSEPAGWRANSLSLLLALFACWGVVARVSHTSSIVQTP